MDRYRCISSVVPDNPEYASDNRGVRRRGYTLLTQTLRSVVLLQGIVLALSGMSVAWAEDGTSVHPLVASLPADMHEMDVHTVDGVRQAIIVDPDPSSKPRPLVLVLHGHMGSAAQALGLKRFGSSPLSVWVAIARREHLIIAALDGRRGGDGQQGWNDCRSDADDNPKTDDVAFARTVVQQLVTNHQADPNRIYAMGMSNGAMMSYRLGMALPELTAFAAASGSMATNSQCQAKPTGNVAALMIEGDADPIVPYAGGTVGFAHRMPRGDVIPIETTFALWAKAHQQDPGKAMQQYLKPQLSDDATSGIVQYFGTSPAASKVTFVHVVGGGHVEPSLTQRYGPLYLHLVGQQSSIFESATFAWQFFKDKVHAASAEDK